MLPEDPGAPNMSCFKQELQGLLKTSPVSLVFLQVVTISFAAIPEPHSCQTLIVPLQWINTLHKPFHLSPIEIVNRNIRGCRNVFGQQKTGSGIDTSVHSLLLGWQTICVQHKNQYSNRKKIKFKLLPSHLLASSALFRSLSGKASSQSSIVLISFPLFE